MIWFSLDIEGPKDEEPPTVQVIGEGDSILIPWGTRLEFYLRLPPESRLELEQVKFVGNSAGSLEVELKEDGVEAERMGNVDSPAENFEIRFPGDNERVVRLTLRAVPRQAVGSARSGAIVSGAVIRAPNPSKAVQAARSSSAADRSRSSRRIEDRNVLLYVVDTLRADHMGMYGYPRPVTPNLDRFAAGATIFDNAVAQSSWTRASMPAGT